MKFNWVLISALGKNKIVNSSYIYLFIVPVLAKLLSKVNSPLIFLFNGKEHELIIELPFNWTIFYFSALFFTIGSIIYNWRAPSIIKENKSFGSFLIAKKNMDHLFQYAEEIGMDPNRIEGIFIWRVVDAQNENQLSLGFWEVFKEANKSRKVSLGFATICYFFGLLLITWLILQGFLEVQGLTS
ncbi:hypothetical protein FVB32_05365 [Flagellimonas hymeniacidonis]|uniref:Uncharacterized protein n=1 Tax=Flagellimonas hymeniacidonis TaxID=2603628 RepID=A0A5C8VAA1_9FLAO|nr:hypothetical protein [Flagellimonas hymeniacidonis]TXN37718.1 hypothetical protein FVB32_05365 [Flagellimonas hymeniacidonis]